MSALLAGYLLGLAVAAGFGPISVLAVSSGLQHGFAPAFGVGLGAAAVDGLYALLAALGLAALVPGAELQVVGGLALLVLAWKMAGAAGGEALALGTLRRGFGVSFAGTLANPSTILSWAAAFAAVVPALELSRAATLTVLPVAVFAGTLTWFTVLATGTSVARHRLGPAALRRASVAGAVVIGVLGLVLLADGVVALSR